jgi:hypothetical protein
MLVIRTTKGVEIRIPLDELDSIQEVEPATQEVRPVAQHPYLHREGVNRCAACWRPRTDPSHSDVAVHER